jgi:membrane-anchored glycerophosphoryl diester phosphodiesterase (GDPDase)
MLPLTILNNLTILIHKPLFTSFWEKTILNFKKLNLYYLRTEHLWLDGFLFDFLQKKTADMWVRKFVIYTGFLFSERLVFDAIVKLYMDYFV